jgi:hypothetical protein
MARDLSDLGLLVIQIDGIHMDEDMTLVAAIGVDANGDKHPLGLVEGATENAATVQALIDNLVERGLDPALPRLFIIDGSKALSKAIRAAFGRDVAIQRCQIHKARNIMDRLPKSMHAQVTFLRFCGHGSSGLALCLFGGDIPKGGMKPLTIVISFDVSEQIVPGSLLVRVASLMHEFGFDRAKAAFHRGIVPTISLPAHGLDHPGCIEDLAVIGSGVLAAAIGMMDQAWRRLLPLDGHGQCRDRQIRPHVVTHRPADDLPCEKIEHDSQIEPSFLGWDIGDVSEPDSIRPLGDEFLGEPVGGNGPIMAAVGGACSEPARRYCLDTVMAHEPLNPATARRVPQAAQGRMDSWPAIAPAMGQMEAPDLGEQSTIGRLARTFGPAAPSIIPCRRDAHDIAQDTNRERLALIFDDAEFHFGSSEKMRSVFFRISRSMRRRSFSRRRRTFSVAKSRPAGGIAACVMGRRGDPAWLPAFLLHQARSRAAGIPSSPAIWLNGRPLLAKSPTASRLNSSVY